MKEFSKEQKMTLQLIAGFVLCIFGMLMLIAGFIVPPLGIIDNSVLVAYGEVMTFSGGLVGIDYTYKYKIFKTNKENKSNE